MAIWNPPYQAIRFVEEHLLPAKPFIFGENVSFNLTESFTINTPPTPPTPVPAPSTIDIAESLSFTLAEVVTVPANPSAVSETITFDISESMVITT